MTSILEYNQEEEEKKLRAAEWQTGYDEGYDKGRIKQYNMINNYIEKKNASLEEACDTLGVSLEEYHEAEKLYKSSKS